MKRLKILSLFLFLSFPLQGLADGDPSVETEALEIADRLRCLVCSDENIETAQDETAKDMRFLCDVIWRTVKRRIWLSIYYWHNTEK